MGADGGVCWADVSDTEAFRVLVDPFGFLYWEDYMDEYHEVWMAEQPDLPNRVYATYGPGQETIEALQEALLDLAYMLENPPEPWERTKGWLDFTFEEIALDMKTRPSWEGKVRLGPLEEMVDRVAFLFGRKNPSEVYKMTARDWYAAVQATNPTFGSVETWT